MDNIFAKEEQVISRAEALLSEKLLQSAKDANYYRDLLKEYKILLSQIIKIVKMADKTQLDLKTVSEKLDRLSHIDALTGLYNRRYFNETYVKEWNSAARSKTELALTIIDIDYFKMYNDTYGHLQGDDCLKAVAKGIKASVKRPRDLAARFGGEEFVVLLPETGLEGAARIAQDILEHVQNMGIEHPSSPWQNKVTVSLGVAAMLPHESLAKEELINNGDKALYLAKDSGRNCFRLFV